MIKATRMVRVFYYPEVRAEISALAAEFPHDEMIPTGSKIDALHEGVVDMHAKYLFPWVSGLGSYAYRWPTAGCTEGIKEALGGLAASGTNEIYVLCGEYEGFMEAAEPKGIRVTELSPEEALLARPGHFFLSNPSSRDGNALPEWLLAGILDRHKVFYDITYAGAGLPEAIDVSHPNILAVFSSMSKSLGLFYYRIGFMFARQRYPVLDWNRYFKNAFSLLVAKRVMSRFQHGELPSKYKTLQESVVERLNEEYDVPLVASESVLLAHVPMSVSAIMTDSQRKILAPYDRKSNWRLCLTPYYEDEDAQ